MPSSAEYVLAPQVAQKIAAQQEKVLLVFDDILLHQFKERAVYDLAEQPFSPVNILNQIMENTGNFHHGRQQTSILITDTDCNTLTF